MNIYLVEKPNGNFGIVAAQTKNEARVLFYQASPDDLKKTYPSLAQDSSLTRITCLGTADPLYDTPQVIAASPSWTRSHSFTGQKG